MWKRKNDGRSWQESYDYKICFARRYEFAEQAPSKTQFLDLGPVGDAFEGGSKLVRPFVRPFPLFWHFCAIASSVVTLYEDFQSVWRGIFGIFRGFSVGAARHFWHFSRIFSRRGEACLTLFEDFQSVW